MLVRSYIIVASLLTFLLVALIQFPKVALQRANFKHYINEPAMILNYQMDNTIEGNYLQVKKINQTDSCVEINLPQNFFIKNTNCAQWTIGWGNKKNYEDGGSENIRAIKSIGKNKIQLGKLLCGSGFPDIKQHVVFWNSQTNGYINYQQEPIIHANWFKGIGSQSLHFANVVYDSALNKYIMPFNCINEKGPEPIDIYAAQSEDLLHWEAANNGEPILTIHDFKNISWANGNIINGKKQGAFVSDLVRYNGQWYLFLDAIGNDNKRKIGLAISKTNSISNYSILPSVIIGNDYSWNELSSFYPKLVKYKNEMFLFFVGKNNTGHEQLGLATSNNLLDWKIKYPYPIINQHAGWRDNTGSSECNYIEVKNDSIFLIMAGSKVHRTDPVAHYITRNIGKDKSGNVGDAQLGVYISTNGGRTFVPHKNNPVFINDYTNPYQNDHLGGNFARVVTDTMEYIFYHAKAKKPQAQYNIFVKVKRR